VSLYTWTKGIAAGAYLVPALLVLFGLLSPDSAIWRMVAPVLAGAFLAATGALLVWDLAQPTRFYLIFTRPQWKSWLVKGAVIIAAYSAALLVHFIASLADASSVPLPLMIAALPLSVMSAVYTAYLFAQAKARDLWQNPLLPPHLAVQALLAGSAALVPFATLLEPSIVPALLWLLAATSLLHLLMVWGEATVTHGTAHARLAAWEMTSGTYRPYFQSGVMLVAVGVLAPWIGLWAIPAALAGLLAHEHAYVQAGQAVPLA
jgi:hypothetical protein